MELQGRIFSVRRLIGMAVIPLASLLSGPFADHVLELALRSGGALVPLLGGIFGTGPGAGIRLLFTLSGVAMAVLGPVAWLFSHVREAEKRLPDPEPNTPTP